MVETLPCASIYDKMLPCRRESKNNSIFFFFNAVAVALSNGTVSFKTS